MTQEEQSSQSVHKRGSCITLSPWIVLVAALVLYALTLNHWVTLSSLPFVSQVTGWDWHPGPLPWRMGLVNPLTMILTAPCHLVPAYWKPIALNIFTAVCAALTLALLARSVRLLPQDRTKEQRMRQLGDYALLYLPTAFIPAALAAVMLAFNLAFWQNSITATGEMLNVLVFAFLIWSLLDFRISQNPWRLSIFALVYGLGAANDWAMVGFFPCFLVAVVWLKGRSFFQVGFILKTTGWGLLGALLYLFLPLKGAIAGDGSVWTLLHLELSRQYIFLRIFPRYVLLTIWGPILLPLLFAAINWPSFEGEVNPGANVLTQLMFRLAHIFFFLLTAVMCLNTKYSPNPERMGLPGFLSFHYLTALGLGYFSGYILQVFGQPILYRWARAKGVPLVVNQVILGVFYVAAIVFPIYLVAANYSGIRALNGNIVPAFAQLEIETVPAKPAFLLGDDALRLHLGAAALERKGKLGQYVLLETGSLGQPLYLRYLANRYPMFKEMLVNPEQLPTAVSHRELADLLYHMAQVKPVYYLHPSAGYFFERTHFIPHGIGGDVESFKGIADGIQVQVMTTNQIAANQQFWHSAYNMTMGGLAEMNSTRTDAARTEAAVVAQMYSQDLNNWGVELQRAATAFNTPGMLKNADEEFSLAAKFNPDNTMARYNLQYNARLRGEGLTATGGPLLTASNLIVSVRDWMPYLNTFGLPDEPDLDIHVGLELAYNHDLYQAAQFFQRALQLRPDDLSAELDLAKSCVDLGLPNDALNIVARIRQRVSNVSDEVVRTEALALMKKGELGAADRLLTEEAEKHPHDESFLGLQVQFYLTMGYESRSADPSKKGQDMARNYFVKSLEAARKQLAMLNSPTAPASATARIPAVMFDKSELEMLLSQYKDAIDTLTRLMQLEPGNFLYVLNRAIAELQGGYLDAAKADYQTVEKNFKDKTPYQAYYGLGDIAIQQKSAADAVKYYKLYLKAAPTNGLEYSTVVQQVQKMEGH